MGQYLSAPATDKVGLRNRADRAAWRSMQGSDLKPALSREPGSRPRGLSARWIAAGGPPMCLPPPLECAYRPCRCRAGPPTPFPAQESEEGHGEHLAYGLAAMQGWRVSMVRRRWMLPPLPPRLLACRCSCGASPCCGLVSAAAVPTGRPRCCMALHRTAAGGCAHLCPGPGARLQDLALLRV